MQPSLFPISQLPEGFQYRPEFLSVAEEAELLSTIRKLDFHDVDFQGHRAKRRVLQYGWKYDFGTRKASPGNPTPDFLLSLQSRCAGFIGTHQRSIVEAIVTEYPPGAPIGWHRDAAEFETIIGVSLLGRCRLRLREFAKQAKIISIVLEPRSIYVLADFSRWKYQHSIAPVTTLRYSITFRTAKQNI